jgi:hypothetical protein
MCVHTDIYCPWGGMPLAPFALYVSQATLTTSDALSRAIPCASSIDTEPSNGEPLYVSCGNVEVRGDDNVRSATRLAHTQCMRFNMHTPTSARVHTLRARISNAICA